MHEPLDICIDVSHHQGMIDWPAVRGAGILIAMIKATEGTGFTDSMFEWNRREAENAGIAVIPYHFLRAGSPESQADHFGGVAAIELGSPFALDWEGAASSTATAADVETAGMILASIARRPPLGYWGRPGSTPGAPTAAMRTWPRWVPRYPKAGTGSWGAVPKAARADPGDWWAPDDAPDHLSRLLFAQYTDAGRVRGVNRPVDRSVAFFDTAADAVSWVRGAGAVPAQPVTRTFLEADPIVLQRHLVALGYPLDLDGDAGPQTCGAALAALTLADKE